VSGSPRLASIKGFLRANALGAGLGVLLLAVAATGVRWVASSREGPPPRKVMQYTMVNIQPHPQPKAPPQTQPPQQRIEEKVQADRVALKASDIPPPDAPPPSPSSPAGGPLALAAEGEGPGDQFNLAGNPGGRGLLSGGGLGDGTGGDGLGGSSSVEARFGWYYSRIASEIEEAFRRHKLLSAAATRVELRLWADASGVISRVELVRSTGDQRVDDAIRSIVGLRLKEAPPRDIPMPMVARFTARRPG